MPRQADPPFSGYTLYGPVMDRREGRRKVFLVHRTNRSRTTMTLARYRMCVHLGRKLSRTEEVDHKDEDRLNDDLNNLQILTRRQNRRKSSSHRGKAMVRLRCPGCGKTFERERRQTHLIKGGPFTACGRSCSRTAVGKLQRRHPPQAIKEAIRKNVIEEFRSHN